MMTGAAEEAQPGALWRADKVGAQVSVEGGHATVSRKSRSGWGTQLVDHWLGIDPLVNRIIMRIDELEGEMNLGVVGRNYNPSDWAAPLCTSSHAVVVDAEGKVTYKGEGTSYRLRGGMGAGDVIALSVDMKARTLTVEQLGADGLPTRSVAVDGLPPEVAVVVGFGPGTQRVTIVEAVAHRADEIAPTKLVKDLWDEDNVIKPLQLNERSKSDMLKQKMLEKETAEGMDA